MGVAAHPARATAQEPTPAAKSSPGSGENVDSAIANAGAKNTAAEDENVYRHTPLVRSLAKLLHLDVEITARLFEFLNFAIVALAIVIPLARLMPKVLRKRSETLRARY